MKKNRITAVLIAVLTACSAGMNVSAEGTFSREEAISKLWNSRAKSYNDDGTEFPESSWYYNVLVNWVDTNYDDMCWSTDISYWDYKYDQYYYDLINGWDFNDDNAGNWTIITDEGETYGFEYIDDQWFQYDGTGSVVDTFHPVNTLKESITTESISTTESVTYTTTKAKASAVRSTTVGNDTPKNTTAYKDRYSSNQTAIRANEIDTNATAVNAAQSTSEEQKNNASPMMFAFIGLTVVAAGLGAVYVIKTKKK